MLLSVKPCSAHGSRFNGKPASIYWAWFLADGSRRAYRQILCADCFREGPLATIQAALENEASCPFCHTVSGDEADYVYATIYVPKQEPVECAIACCGADAAALRATSMAGAKLMPDREAGMRGPSSSLTSAWDAMGLRPDLPRP
jgi:hypothetical protein